MGWLLRAFRARELPDSDDGDEPPEGDDGAEGGGDRWRKRYQASKVLRLRCFACAGTGEICLIDDGPKGGRAARCPACHGTGRVTLG